MSESPRRSPPRRRNASDESANKQSESVQAETPETSSEAAVEPSGSEASKEQTKSKKTLPSNEPRMRTPIEMLAYKQQTLLMDDEYTTELRLQVVHYGEKLLARVHFEVEVLEKELIALSGVFNEFLKDVKTMDEKIGKLSTSINQGKLEAAKELDRVIKQEVQTVVEQLRLLPKADLDGVEVLYQNLDALQDNYQVINKQLETLDEIGIKTEQLRERLPALEKGLNQFGSSIEERQMNLLVGEEEEAEDKIDYEQLRDELAALIVSQHRAMINHLRQAQTMANPKEVEMLKRNQVNFEKSYTQIGEQLENLKEAGQEVDELQQQLQPIAAGLKQFERALGGNQFLKFTERLYEEVEVVNEQIQEAHACVSVDDIEILDENVEVLFENCDAFADELDEMAEQGLDVDSVIEHYEVLRLAVEQFEAAVQDASNRVGLTSGSI